MGYSTGRLGPFGGTGAQTITTNLSGTPTWCRLTVGGKNSGDTVNHFSVGTCDGTRQNVQFTSPTSSGTNNTDVILVKDATGTILLEASWTSFGTSSGSGTVTFNVATNNTSYLPTLEVGN